MDKQNDLTQYWMVTGDELTRGTLKKGRSVEIFLYGELFFFAIYFGRSFNEVAENFV